METVAAAEPPKINNVKLTREMKDVIYKYLAPNL
jgi:hypothetical protein